MDAIPALRRWWWILAVGALTAGVVANIVASRMQPTYVAQARLLVGPINGDKDTLLASGQLTRTYAELATSRPVLQSVITASGVPTTVERFTEQVTTTSNDVTRIVTISVDETDPGVAASLSNAIADRLRELSTATPEQDAAALDALRRQAEIAALGARARAEVQTAAERVLKQDAGRIEIIEPAARPTDSRGPRVGLLTILAALAGLIVAGIALYVRAAATGRDADREGVVLPPGTADLGLVDVPRIRSQRAPAVASRPDSAAAERYRLLVAKLGLLQQDPVASAIVVVGTEDGWPGAVVAANVAAVLSEARRSVLLLDAGVERAGVSALHGLQRPPSYGELVEPSPSYGELVERPEGLDGAIDERAAGLAPRLRIVPRAQRPVGLLTEEAARALLARARETADVVIIAASPMQQSTAALAWGPVVDGTVLVGGVTRDAEHRIQEAAQALSLVGARVLGAVTARRAGWGVPGQDRSTPGRAETETRSSTPDEPTLASR
jgi:Mrp family chromosome partitioning ATPase/capsular polysaccharide biosynthesis protein